MIPTKKERGIIIGTKLGAVSRFKLVARKADSGIIVKESGWSENLIPTVGLDLALRGGFHGNPRLTCRVGTGNAVPQMTDTDLQARHGGTSGLSPLSESVTWQTTVAPYWRKATATFRFGAGTFNNTNIAEVGTFEHYSGANAMYSRALVVDALGNPAAVTLLIDEVLDVIWEHYTIVDISEGSFNQLIDGVSTPFTYKVGPCVMTGSQWGGGADLPAVQLSTSSSGSGSKLYYNSTSDLGSPVDEAPVGSSFNGYFASSTGSPAFVPGSGVRKFRVNVGLTSSNHANGISGIAFRMGGVNFKMYMNPPVMKVSTKTYYIDIDVGMTNAAIPE